MRLSSSNQARKAGLVIPGSSDSELAAACEDVRTKGLRPWIET